MRASPRSSIFLTQFARAIMSILAFLLTAMSMQNAEIVFKIIRLYFEIVFPLAIKTYFPT